MYRAAFALTLIGAILLIVAIVLPLVFPMIFTSQIDKKLIIAPESEMVEKFQETPVPIYFQIWIFNLTNAEEVLEGEKPILKQLGPYTYRQRRMRVGLQWHPNTGTVSFKSKKFFYFEPDLSSGLESDIVTTIDPVYTALAFKLNSTSTFFRSTATIMFTSFEKAPFMSHTVGELLFGGYDEPLLRVLYILTQDPEHGKGRAGFFYNRNGTIGAEMEVYTGQLGMDNYQHLLKYRKKEMLDYWKEDRCNRLNGTDGSQFARPIQKSKPLFLFTSELCRSIYAVFEKDVKLGPLTLHRFVLPRALLDFSEENKCYCTSDFSCKAGMIDVSPCRDGKPVIISTPHFYQGDHDALLAVEGLNPIKEEHETFIDVEPNTGVSMRVAKRIQINMPLRRYGEFPSLLNVRELVMPILWVNESVEVPMDRVLKLHTTLTLPVKIVTYGSMALLVVGILLVVVAFFLTCFTYRKNRLLRNRRQELSDKKSGANDIKLLEKNKLYQVS